MPQFSHPELGGPGQWPHGGMTMIGEMFNDALKTKVKQLCAELASLLSGRSPRIKSSIPASTYQRQPTSPLRLRRNCSASRGAKRASQSRTASWVNWKPRMCPEF
jgi:hypothetical protein